ncbi:hypothetical protein [Microbispora sp. NPDC049125]|uniref:hypothetical protein n=1 Tax=Microbispora sp. NPDC049125 TaxID=3154929 RepID=UPI003465A382
MTSFPAAARRVCDSALDPRERLLALRECVLRFPPYGFRGTWHHVILVARVPQRLERDLESLRRAIDEIEPARRVWMDHRAAYIARRHREKASGRRAADPVARVYSWAGWLAYCPDPEVHPTERLAVVVERVLDAHARRRDSATACLVCGTARGLDQICPGCGVDPRGPITTARARSPYRWRDIWQRTAFLEGQG